MSNPIDFELGGQPPPFLDELTLLFERVPWELDGENSYSWRFIAYVRTADSAVPLGMTQVDLMNSLAQKGSFSYVVFYFSNVCPFMTIEYYRYVKRLIGGSRQFDVYRGNLPRKGQAVQLIRHVREWSINNAITEVPSGVLDMNVADLATPDLHSATGTVFHWLFGSGPMYGHPSPLDPNENLCRRFSYE